MKKGKRNAFPFGTPSEARTLDTLIKSYIGVDKIKIM